MRAPAKVNLRKIGVEDGFDEDLLERTSPSPSPGLARGNTFTSRMSIMGRRVSPNSSPIADIDSKNQAIGRRGIRQQTAVAQNASLFVKKRAPEHAPLSDRFWYYRDRMFEKQWTRYLLLLLTFVTVLTVDACLHMLNKLEDTGETVETEEAEETGFLAHLWMAWIYMADPGTHSDASSSLDKGVAVAISVTGILFFSTVLGFVVDGIRNMLDALKKGKSKVVERGHTLILGWTDRCPALIKEIALACESEGGGTICILAEQDRQVLEAEKAANLSKGDLRGTTVVFRTGSSMVMNDLNLVSASLARNIIVLAPTGVEADKADSVVLRTCLQLKGLRGDIRGHVVAELRDVDNESLVQMVGMGSVETVVSHDIVGRLMLMSARQPGLASVYDAILGFDGDEFYLKEWPELHGVKFSELHLRFPHAVALGVKKFGDLEVTLNPPHDVILSKGDELLVLARDDDSYSPTDPITDKTITDIGNVPPDVGEMPTPEKILMCGWRRDVDDVIKELDNMVVKGSELHMLSEVPVDDRAGMLEKGGLELEALRNLRIVHFFGNSAVRRQIEELPLADYDSILILADEMRESDMMHSDSHSLASLLLIRDIQKKRLAPAKYHRDQEEVRLKRASLVPNILESINGQIENSSHPDKKSRRYSATAENATDLGEEVVVEEVEGCLSVCEVLDHRTRKTIRNSRSLCQASDFVQSNEFVSRVLAMVAERKEMKSVLVDLLGSEGTSLCVNATNRYATKGEMLCFYSMALRVQEYKGILCGYKQHGHEPVLNPVNKDSLMCWDDMELIVMQNVQPNNHPDSPQKLTPPSPVEQAADGAELPGVPSWCRDAALKRIQTELHGLSKATKAAVLDQVIALNGA